MYRYLAAIILCASILGCQTIQNDGATSSKYNIFFSQADHIKELLAKGKVQEASNVYSENTSFFTAKGNTFNELLRKLRVNVESLVDPKLNQMSKIANTQVWPVGKNSWGDISSLLTNLEGGINRGKRNEILSHGSKSSSIASAEIALSALRKKITNTIQEEFKRYDLVNDPNFGSVFPVDVNLTGLFDDDVDRVLADMRDRNTDAILKFKSNYSTQLSSSFEKQLAKVYFERIYSVLYSEKLGKIGTLIEAIQKSEEAGFKIIKVDSARIKAIDITSKTLLISKQIEFPIKLKPDLPIDVTVSGLDEAFNSDLKVDTEIIVLIDVAAAKVNREIQTYEAISSEHQIGTSSHQNPAYATTQNSLVQAQMGLQNANMTKMNIDNSYCRGWACLAKLPLQIAAAVKIKEAQEGLEVAMSTMQSTPMMLEKPVYKSYEFRKASIDSSKLAIVNYYIIDKNIGQYVKGTFDAKQSQSFTVPYNMKTKDKDRRRHLSALDSEKDIAAFEEKSFGVSLKSIVQEYSKSKNPPRELISLKFLREQILNDKNVAIARFQADRIRPSNTSEHNKLAQSVVIVHSLKGALGTGFYVNDDLILTNFHVVEGSSFVEMTLKDGTETFGKIIAKDIRLDLALIRTQNRGTPVKFYGKKDIEIGSTTFAIGHPSGLEFSVTRGIVSAIRAHKNVNFHSGKDVYFVQTDTPINPGNSGGPLFLDGQVIGVNDWVVSKQIAEGLNFAIHFKEVLKFLKKYDVGVNVGGETS